MISSHARRLSIPLPFWHPGCIGQRCFLENDLNASYLLAGIVTGCGSVACLAWFLFAYLNI